MIEVHAYIDVAELERGIAFYCDGLGLSLKRRLSPSWVELEGGNLPIFLLGNRSPTAQLGGTQIRRDFGRHWTPVHLDFIVRDIDAAVARLTALGAALDRFAIAGEGAVGNRVGDLIEFFGSGYAAVSR